MHPHHLHISYASPRVKSRTGSSEEKKQEVREENAHQHRTARKKKQEVREENAHQHRTAYARLLAENAEAEAKRREEEEAKPLKKEAKRREEQEAKRKEKRENTKKPLQLLNDEWFDLEPADGYPLPSSAQHFSQRQPVTAGKFAFKKSDISLANPFLAKAPSLPRRPGDAGLNIISSSGGTVEAVSKDKQIYYNFRVRRSYVQDLLKLLIRDNHLYSDYTFDEDDESWALLPDDGFHESIPIWEEAKPEDERRPIFEQGRSRRFARFDRFWS